MSEEWRMILYPFGFLSSLAFAARFFLQWMESELKQKSVLRGSFWYLSIFGNVLLWAHAVIQLQIHVCLIQVGNGIIAWRNLNLMQPVERQKKLSVVFFFMGIGTLMSLGLFWLQGYISQQAVVWMRVPIGFVEQDLSGVSLPWHIIGVLGLILFSMRFWVQWWEAERYKKSLLTPTFWWTSIFGALLTIIYFSRIQDPVNLIGPSLGMVPYIRNLILLKRTAS